MIDVRVEVFFVTIANISKLIIIYFKKKICLGVLFVQHCIGASEAMYKIDQTATIIHSK